ncbi:hypothetical protein SPB21_04095 [Leptothoe sp. ISB3NOV94-8A]
MKRFLQSLVLASAISAGSLGFQGEARANRFFNALEDYCNSRIDFTFVGPNVCFRQEENSITITSMTSDGYHLIQIIQLVRESRMTSVAVFTPDSTKIVQAHSYYLHGNQRHDYSVGSDRVLAGFLSDLDQAYDAVEYWLYAEGLY